MRHQGFVKVEGANRLNMNQYLRPKVKIQGALNEQSVIKQQVSPKVSNPCAARDGETLLDTCTT